MWRCDAKSSEICTAVLSQSVSTSFVQGSNKLTSQPNAILKVFVFDQTTSDAKKSGYRLKSTKLNKSISRIRRSPEVDRQRLPSHVESPSNFMLQHGLGLRYPVMQLSGSQRSSASSYG